MDDESGNDGNAQRQPPGCSIRFLPREKLPHLREIYGCGGGFPAASINAPHLLIIGFFLKMDDVCVCML